VATWKLLFARLSIWQNAGFPAKRRLTIRDTDEGSDRKTVTAKFMNIDRREEIHFDFLRNDRRWLLDEVHSTSATPWTLSEIDFEVLPVARRIRSRSRRSNSQEICAWWA
jgi:hypothetical protein